MNARAVFLAAGLAVGLGLLVGCSPFGVDVHDRLSVFAATLNATDRSAINSNFDPTLTANLPTMNAAWWNTNFPSPLDGDHAYGITLFDYSDPANVVAAIRGPPAFNQNTGDPVNALFVMSKVGPDWYIERLYLNGNAVALIQ
jgi:hypothetical protein